MNDNGDGPNTDSIELVRLPFSYSSITPLYYFTPPFRSSTSQAADHVKDAFGLGKTIPLDASLRLPILIIIATAFFFENHRSVNATNEKLGTWNRREENEVKRNGND